MAWFKRIDKKKIKEKDKKSIPDGLWDKCMSCGEIIYCPELEKNLFVCHHCNHHFRVNPNLYKDLLLDEGTIQEHFRNLGPVDFLKFETDKSYENQIHEAKVKTGDKDGIKIYEGKLNYKIHNTWGDEFPFYWRKHGICYWRGGIAFNQTRR